MTTPDPEKVQRIIAELRDINKDKRRTAVMKLGMIGGEEAIRTLMRTVENRREDLIVRGRSALMLGKLRDARAVNPLIRALDAPGFQTPFYAAQALGNLGDDRAIEPLVMMAAKSKGKVRDAALQALEQLGYQTEEELEPEPEA